MAVDIKSTATGEMLATSSGSYFYLKDELGSIIDIVDDSGSLVQHYAYSSFGKLLKISDANGDDVMAAPSVKTSYGFTNREHDEESGMMYYRARYYMPEIGRFIQEDPDPGKVEQPMTNINKFSYVLNNPIRYTDPKGKFVFTVSAFLIAASVYTIGSVIGKGIANLSAGRDFFNGLTLKGLAITFGTGLFAYGLYGTTTVIGIFGGALVGLAVSTLLNFAEANDIVREEDRDEYDALLNIGLTLVLPSINDSSEKNSCFFGSGYSSCDALGTR